MLMIQNVRIVDPASGVDTVASLSVKNGKICEIGETLSVPEGATVIDGRGLVAAPGLVDMHVHLRDPGLTHKEDIHSGARAAARGGVTTMVCMPNTSPVIDSPETVRYVREKAGETAVTILPYGAVTVGQKGAALTDFAALKAAGVVALSDDGLPIDTASVMRAALQQAKGLELLISAHCEDGGLAGDKSVNEGRMSEKLGLPGRPAIAEELMILRDVALAKETGAAVHIAHVSTEGSVEIIRRAKAEGIRVTAETCPQYFTLTEDALEKGALAKVNPPLRTEEDRQAIISGLVDKTIDAIATDHAPHSAEEKSRALTAAPSGISGLETSLALSLTVLYHGGHLSLLEIIRLMSASPASILGINKGRISVGDDADLVLFDPEESWVVKPEAFLSKGKNTPFGGMTLKGNVRYTIVGGKIICP